MYPESHDDVMVIVKHREKKAKIIEKEKSPFWPFHWSENEFYRKKHRFFGIK